jgi:hypothetical protein
MSYRDPPAYEIGEWGGNRRAIVSGYRKIGPWARMVWST